MTKAITKDRIIKALNRIHSVQSSKIGRDMEVVKTMATLGIRNAFGVSTETDIQRTDLDLTYLEVAKDSQSLQEACARCFYQVKRFGDRSERVYEIQQKYQVSGLAETTTKLGDKVIHHLAEDEDLRLIKSGLPKLAESKKKLFQEWINHSSANELDIWVRTKKTEKDDWNQSSFGAVITSLPFYDWAKVWEDIDYISPSIMRSQGWDEPRRSPKLPDDTKRLEVHLFLGKGIDWDSPEHSIWFCASNTKPCL